jgi:D-glutamate cyclase
MSDAILTELRDIIQDDIGKRGLRTDPERNLVNACPDDLRAACHSLANHSAPGLAVVTGFFIPTATPPAGETDGPLGALFLARALVPLGIPVVLVTDDFCVRSLEAGLGECGMRKQVPVVTLPTPAQAQKMSDTEYWQYFNERKGIPALTHLLAIERVGPSHVVDAVPPEHRDRCHTMRGRDISSMMSPAHKLFAGTEPESQARVTQHPSLALRAQRITTIGIGDGGNEIGMGKIPWDVIDRNIPNGGLVACRIPTEYLIVCGVSNWGAYALAAGVGLLRGKALDSTLFDSAREREILKVMVEEGELVDGVLGKPSVTVDGLNWEQYAGALTRIGAVQ